MDDSQDRLREMLHRRGDRVHSSLTISDIRDAGLRSHRHPMRLLGPVLVAASVVILVLVVTLTGRTGSPTTPPAGPGPAGPGPGVSRTVVPTTTAVHSSRIATPSVTGTTTTSLPVTTSTAASTPSTAAASTTVRASP